MQQQAKKHQEMKTSTPTPSLGYLDHTHKSDTKGNTNLSHAIQPTNITHMTPPPLLRAIWRVSLGFTTHKVVCNLPIKKTISCISMFLSNKDWNIMLESHLTPNTVENWTCTSSPILTFNILVMMGPAHFTKIKNKYSPYVEPHIDP